MAGALEGLTIVEIAGIGPGPFAGMMLADHGARVIRVERAGGGGLTGGRGDILCRSRERVIADLKSPEGVAQVRDLCRTADGLIEGFRPGVMERLGLGPDVLLADNPRLVYGRMTGWGQDGPLAGAAGHDINYIALAGNLDSYGRAGELPVPPTNAVGDFGGGGMLMAFGMLAGILSAGRTGRGQVVDCAMVDGAALIHAMMWAFRGMGMWNGARGTNLLDTGAPFYDVYVCADGGLVSIAPIEPQFWQTFLTALQLTDDPDFAAQHDRSKWPLMKARLTTIFAAQPRDHWVALMEGSDICFAPVLSMAEAPAHPHNAARDTFAEVAGVVQPMPAPRFGETPAPMPRMEDR